MLSNLLEQLTLLPDKPGVYQYFDNHGKLLYIGKAKSLKNRVKSYFRFTPTLLPATDLSPRITKMVHEIVSLSTIIVESESDALILENSLIKQLKPKYNILLRDDKTYPYLYIDFNDPFPRVELTRKVIQGKKIRYFGPFVRGARDIQKALYEVLPLVQKKSCLKEGKKCLFYQIKRCLAPCESLITSAEYLPIIEEACELIHHKSALLTRLTHEMEKLAEELRFEEAGQLRDQIRAITESNPLSGIDLASNENFDLFATAEDGTRLCLVKLFIRNGRIVSSDHTIVSCHEFDKSAIYKQALVDLYTYDTPLQIHDIIVAESFDDIKAVETLLKKQFGTKMSLSIPHTVSKKRMSSLAQTNAQEILRLHHHHDNIATLLSTLFETSSPLERIECFDASHHSGSSPVGAMVVWESGKFVKDAFRHYNLTTTNEYAQMREILLHRVQSFEKSSPPDMWLIDGGIANVNLAYDILQSVGVDLYVVGIAKEKIDAKAHRAKGQAHDKLYTQERTYDLGTHDKRLQVLQSIRDEAHRFAITFHRKQKTKQAKTLSLLHVEGIGPGRVKKLLDYFGTFEAIENADISTLCDVIPSSLAQKVYDFFKKL